MRKPDIALLPGFAAAMLLAFSAVAQDAPPATTDAPPPVVSGDGSATPTAAPSLESPALGPLGGRDTPYVGRMPEGGALSGFVTTAPGIGLPQIGTPLDPGNRPYAIRPSIGVGLLATNNVFQTRQDPSSDVVATVSPSIEAAVATSRITGLLRYTPSLRLYAVNSSQDGIDQVGDGHLLAALVPGLFYVDARGSASVLPVAPGQIPGSSQFSAGSQNLQTFTGQVTPFLVHRFGSAATAQLGYSFQYSLQGSADFSNSNQENAASFIGHRGFAVLRSGEDLGRLALQARVDGTRYVGDGIYSGAHNFVTALEMRYAVLRSVALLGEIGYEDQAYSGTNPYSISDAIWSVGLRLIPSADSIVIVRYGHHNGFNSFRLNAGVRLGVRTDLSAAYRDTIGTSLTEAQDLLTTITTDPLGNIVDSQSGAPVVLINSFLGLSNTLYRLRMATATLRHFWPRDSLTLSATWQEQTPITSAINTFPVSANNGIYATLNWAHEFSPRTAGMASAQYGSINYGQPGPGQANIYALAATLTHRLTDKVNGGVQVAWTNNTDSQPGQGYSQFLIRVGLRRTF